MFCAAGVYHAEVDKKENIILLLTFMSAKLYTIGLIRTLNSRGKLRAEMNGHKMGRTTVTETTETEWKQGPGHGPVPVSVF
jgi:hypothetical protein